MKKVGNDYLQEYLSNLQLNVTAAAHTKVSRSWQDFDFIPDFNRFYFIRDGEGYVKIQDKEYYPVPGQLFLLPAGVKQSYSVTNDNVYTKFWCHFTATIGSVNLFQILQLCPFVQVKEPDVLEQHFAQLIHYFQSTEITSTLRMKAVLLEIMAIYLEQNQPAKISVSSSSSVEKINVVLRYIDQHLCQNLSIEELADLVHFHPNYFIPFFKTIMGTSPIQYINKIRIEKAKQLLTVTDRNVTEISEAVGMNNYYFSRIFKSFTGYTPSSYRSMIQKEILERHD
jgi:AraC family transcriptional regulator, arabinose operon regulatory protein